MGLRRLTVLKPLKTHQCTSSLLMPVLLSFQGALQGTLLAVSHEDGGFRCGWRGDLAQKFADGIDRQAEPGPRSPIT